MNRPAKSLPEPVLMPSSSVLAGYRRFRHAVGQVNPKDTPLPRATVVLLLARLLYKGDLGSRRRVLSAHGASAKPPAFRAPLRDVRLKTAVGHTRARNSCGIRCCWAEGVSAEDANFRGGLGHDRARQERVRRNAWTDLVGPFFSRIGSGQCDELDGASRASRPHMWSHTRAESCHVKRNVPIPSVGTECTAIVRVRPPM